MLVKCQLCQKKNERELMDYVSKPTGKLNKNGTEKIKKEYIHPECKEEYIRIKAFKEQEAAQWEELYEYVKELHNLTALDGRMIEKLQDLRNGTIKIHNRKIKKHKEGVGYDLMLQTYRLIHERIDYILTSNEFQTKWNEFSYVFGMVINNVNDVKHMAKQQERMQNVTKTSYADVDMVIQKKKNKKDDMDISNFL